MGDGAEYLFSVAFFLVTYKFVPLYLATLWDKTFPAVGGRLPSTWWTGPSASSSSSASCI